jgi:putative photosynthetic complex assembly protein 2
MNQPGAPEVAAFAGPLVFALVIWWSSTLLVLYLDGLPPRTHRVSLLGSSLAAAVALYALHATRDVETVAAAYCAFASAVVVWGWLEMSFLTGRVTGPRTTPCPPDGTGWRRWRYAIEAILYHEIALLVVGGIVLAIGWGHANVVGAGTFLVLWVMRLSAKLNLFLGARNPGEEYLPDHLRYLGTYFRRRPMNWLFPWSVVVPIGVLMVLFRIAAAVDATPFQTAGTMLVAALLSLAVLEHFLLMVPLSSTGLWSLGMKSRRREPAVATVKSD